MKHIFCGIATTAVVLACGMANGACNSCASCSSCGNSGKQTIRITVGNQSGSYVAGAPIAVSNADSSGTVMVAPTVRTSTNGVNLQYAGGTSDIDARAPNYYATRNAGNGGQNVVATGANDFDYERTRDWVPPTPGDDYVSNQGYRQPTTNAQSSYPQPNDYYQPKDYYVDDYRINRDEPRYPRTESRNGSGAYSWNGEGMWYVGAHLDLNLLSWKNKYRATPIEAVTDPGADHDDYRFKPLFGGNIFAGYRFNSHWRSDLEFGFTSSYSDSGGGLTFELSVPYLTANGYYDFANGLYLGVGLGMAFPTVSMEWAYFTGGDSDKTETTFTAAGMIGYSYYLSESLVLDLRLRVSAMDGPSITRGVGNYIVNGVALQSLETEVGTVWNTAVSVGFKYEF